MALSLIVQLLILAVTAYLVHVFVNTMTYSGLKVGRGIWQHLLKQKETDMPQNSPYTILLTEEEKQELEKEVRKYTSPYYKVVRAKVILLAHEGLQNKEIGSRLELPRQIVCKWRKRFFEERLGGLEDLPRPGRKPVFPP